jgi:hypothetical protein
MTTMTGSFRMLVVVGALSAGLPGVALAQGDIVPGEEKKAETAAQEVPAEAKPAEEVLKKYLDAVKAKKWADAKKLTHPKTLEAIAQRKKRLGNEDHPMAPWYYEKIEYYLKEYKVKGATQGPMGTWVFETSEDNFQVQEKGLAEGDMATYLVGKSGGKWVVVDKKRSITFTDDSVKFGYKNYFDKVEEKKAE